MSQVPGLGHVASYFYSTLFHSPLVGVDKETLATCTLSFPREVGRRNELGQLNSIGHDRDYLSLNRTKLKRGHEFPTYVPCVSQKLVVPSS